MGLLDLFRAPIAFGQDVIKASGMSASEIARRAAAQAGVKIPNLVPLEPEIKSLEAKWSALESRIKTANAYRDTRFPQMARQNPKLAPDIENYLANYRKEVSQATAQARSAESFINGAASAGRQAKSSFGFKMDPLAFAKAADGFFQKKRYADEQFDSARVRLDVAIANAQAKERALGPQYSQSRIDQVGGAAWEMMRETGGQAKDIAVQTGQGLLNIGQGALDLGQYGRYLVPVGLGLAALYVVAQYAPRRKD